jgi:AcrR family transcriptional regulator
MSSQRAASVRAKGAAAPGRRSEELTGKRERTRKRIFEATFGLIGHERGLSVRIEEICVAAKISRGTFYNYFTSMEELFQVLAVELSHNFNQALISTLATIDSAAHRTNAAVQHYLTRARRDTVWGWAMVHLSAAGPMFGAESHAACLETVAQGMKAKEFDVPNAECGRDLILGTILSSMISILRGEVSRAQPRVVSRHLLRALGIPDGEARAISESSLPEIVSPLPVESPPGRGAARRTRLPGSP